jgi:flagellar biosynthesis protein FlhF
MKLKSYFSGTVEAALELARKELGEEALLINTRPATAETRYLGAFEVVFGIPEVAPHSERTPTLSSGTGTNEVSQLRSDITSLKRELDRMRYSLHGPEANPPASSIPDGILQTLIDSGLDISLAQQVSRGTALDNTFRTDAALGKTSAERAIVALAGPPGAGKTTTLAKLAARYGIASRKMPHIISADVHRIAAATQLRTLAAILGIGFDEAETPVALCQLLEEHKHKGLVLIDTPGLGPHDVDDASELARVVSAHSEIDTHLVLPACLEPTDLARISDRFQMFAPDKLLFTHMDETERYGALISESVRTSLPISFLSNGQCIPDDLEPASNALLAGLVMSTVQHRGEGTEPHGGQPKRMGAAA